MKNILLILIVITGCAAAEDDVANCATAKDPIVISKNSNEIQVYLKPRQLTYLVGEPVTFTVTIKNNSQEDIKAWVDSLKNQVQIFISNGKGFERYEDRKEPVPKVEPCTVLLAPGKSTSYEFKMLYSIWKKDQKESELALPVSGTYCIKAKYPLFPNRKMFESNVVHTTVKKPTGDDAKIWRKINQPSVLRFLQSGELGTDEEDIPVELADLVEKFPKSGYAESLKHALRWYYDRQMRGMTAETLKSDPWMQRLRKVLDIELEEEPRLFPNDRRLDVKIRLNYPTFTPIQKIYDDLSEQSGVPLHIHPDLRIRRGKGIPRIEQLRKFMKSDADYKAKWIKDGDGYKLMPEAEEPRPEK